MNLFWIFVLMFLFHSATCVVRQKDFKIRPENVTIDTPYGKVKGLTFPSQYEALPSQHVNAFLGVPYTRTLKQWGSDWREKYRFHNPDEDPSWSGVLDATKHKPACPQLPWLVKQTVYGFSDMDEDCLFLDIYTPKSADEPFTTDPNLYPVLVFFPGGGYIMGASRQFPAVFLAERKIVVVVVNYRLNAFGFFTTGDRFAQGNYGMFDQVKALKFVKTAIKSFRGNPDKVTIMGQSAGAASVGMHLLSPRSVGLFHQAIMLSGSELSEWAVLKTDDAKEYAQKLCREIGCPTADSQQMVDCLKFSRSFSEIVNATARIIMKPGKIGNPFGPILDGDIVGVDYSFLPEPPQTLRRAGRMAQVPVLAGMVKDEGSYFIPNLPNLIDGVTEAQFDNILREFIETRGVQQIHSMKDAMEFQYTYWPQPKNMSWIRHKLVEMMSDYMFGAAMAETIRSQVQFATVYFYVFEYTSKYNYSPRWRGIPHGQDLDYIFGMPFVNESYMDFLGIYPRQTYDDRDRQMSEMMISIITNFTARAEPTSQRINKQGMYNVEWYHYNPDNHTYLSINEKSENKKAYRINQVHFWNDFFPRLASYISYSSSSKDEDVENASVYQKTTWGLTAASGLLLIIVICLMVVLICRSRTKHYPQKGMSKYGSKSNQSLHSYV